jgi:hypothetical protein
LAPYLGSEIIIRTCAILERTSWATRLLPKTFLYARVREETGEKGRLMSMWR